MDDDELIQRGIAEGHLKPMKNPRHSSESVDHFTPPAIVEAARSLLGGIDLDPASCPEANSYIKAKLIFTKRDDGFVTSWKGRVFLNPPGGRMENNRSSQKEWWFKLAREWIEGRVEAAIFVCFSVELLQTTQVDTPPRDVRDRLGRLPLPLDFPICFPSRRIAYLKEGPGGKLIVGSSPPHASCIIFLPPEDGLQKFPDFVLDFSPIGKTIRPANPLRRSW
jgi:hypothetical protein